MSDASRHVRRLRVLTNGEAKILQFMRDNGHPGYDNEILVLTSLFNETVAEAGPGGNHCKVTQAKLDSIAKEIDEIIQSACDRYDDWATDAMP